MTEQGQSLAGGATPGAEEIRTTRMVLVDGRGHARATLGCGADGTPALQLFDPLDQPRVQLVLDATGAANLKLHDRDGEVSAWLSVGANGAPSLYLRGVGRQRVQARGHAELCIDEHGCPILSLYDKDGRPRVLLSLNEKDGAPSLSFSNARGELRALLSGDAERGLLDLYPERRPDPAVPTLPLGPSRSPEPALTVEPALNGEPIRGHEEPALPEMAVADLDEAPAPRDVAGRAPVQVADYSPPAPADAEPSTVAMPATSAALDEPTRRSAPPKRRSGPGLVLLVLLGSALGFVGAQLLPPARQSVSAVESKPAPPALAPATDSPPVLRTLEAEELVLKGRDGTTHARLAMLPDGSPFLTLTGPDGKGTVELSVLGSQGTLLKLGEGRALISLHAKENGSSELTLHGKGQEARAALFVQEDGTPVLSLTDEAGRVRAGVTISADGSPSLSLYDEKSLRAFLGSSEGSSSLMLLNREGRVVFQTPR